jgi:cytoskeletal protein CcmA (bactofilin family)
MTGGELDLELELPAQAPSAKGSVLAARHRRALQVGLGGGREGDVARERRRGAEAAAAEPARAGPGIAQGHLAVGAAGGVTGRAAGDAGGDPAARARLPRRTPAVRLEAPGFVIAPSGLTLEEALVVPAGAVVRGYLRCHALLLVGDIVGNVHCTGGPVVIRSGATLKGRLVAAGDVYVCGTVGDGGGGAVVSTRGKLTLAPGARIDGDVRSARLELHDGAMFNGVGRPCEE